MSQKTQKAAVAPHSYQPNIAAGLQMMMSGGGGPTAPPPNGGYARPHGGPVHDGAIETKINKLRDNPTVSNIRKNQQQVDVNGNKVGTNRPDVQYDQGGCHHCVEFDTQPSRGIQHGKTIQKNDASTQIELIIP